MRHNAVEIPADCPQRDERLGWTGDQIDLHHEHLTTGFTGTASLLPALSENGMHAKTEEILFQKDYPG